MKEMPTEVVDREGRVMGCFKDPFAAVKWANANLAGKQGGARVIYYFRDLNVPVYLLAVYAKGEKLNLTAGEKKAMSQMVDQIVNASVHKRLKVVRNS